MSTKALTCIYFNEIPLVCLASHFEGEPMAYGLDLAKFVKKNPLLDDSLDGIEIFSEKLKSYFAASTTIDQVFSRWEGVPFDPEEVTLKAAAEAIFNVQYDSEKPVLIDVLDSKGKGIFKGSPEDFITKYERR